MTDEATQNQSELAGKPAEDTGTQAAESQTSDQTQTQKPEWANRYKSPEDMWEDVRRFQSEADTAKRQLDDFQRQNKAPEQKNEISNEDLVNKFVENPKGFLQEFIAPIQAQIAFQDFARTHPDMEGLRAEMASIVKENPAVLAHPQGLEMVYNHVKAIKVGSQVQQAAQTMQQRREQVEQTKRTTAFVEGSTAPQREGLAPPKPGSSVKEWDDYFDKVGVGWVSDDERRIPDE